MPAGYKVTLHAVHDTPAQPVVGGGQGAGGAQVHEATEGSRATQACARYKLERPGLRGLGVDEAGSREKRRRRERARENGRRPLPPLAAAGGGVDTSCASTRHKQRAGGEKFIICTG